MICLGNSNLGDEGTTALAEGITKSRCLQQLDLECKAVGPAGAASLAKALQKGIGISTLLLARNPLGNSGERCPLALLIDGCNRLIISLIYLHPDIIAPVSGSIVMTTYDMVLADTSYSCKGYRLGEISFLAAVQGLKNLPKDLCTARLLTWTSEIVG